jgi:hypothetical protein
MPEARCHPERTSVDAADRWSESHASYPGRSIALLETARIAERRFDGAVEVSNGQSNPAEPRRRTTHKEETGTMHSMEDGDADQKAEKPEPNRKDSGGTAKDRDEARQASTARGENAGSRRNRF